MLTFLLNEPGIRHVKNIYSLAMQILRERLYKITITNQQENGVVDAWIKGEINQSIHQAVHFVYLQRNQNALESVSVINPNQVPQILHKTY